VILLASLYNLLMAGVDAAVLFRLHRTRTLRGWMLTCACGGTAALVLAFGLAGALAGSRFAIIALAAFGLFLHGFVVLAGSASLLRRARPKTAIASAALAVALVAVAVDAFLIEPYWLEVSHVRLATAKVTRPVRIVVLADLQTDVFGPYEREVLRRVVDQQPDLILLAGDYLHVGGAKRRVLGDRLNAYLDELGFSAPAGVFAVRGNVDSDDWKDIFAGLPVTAVEATRSFELDDLRLTCLGRGDSFNPGLEVPGRGDDHFHLVLGHSPNFAMGRIEADLLVAGHTHGGQVRLPWIRPLITLSRVPRGWAAGLTKLPGGARLLVSRGTGMERGCAPRMRFLCRPELVVIDLVPP